MKKVLDTHEFAHRGIVALRGFVPQKEVGLARASISAELERLKILVRGKIISSKIQNLPVFQQTVRLGQLVGVTDEIRRLFSADLTGIAGSLIGHSLQPGNSEPQVLLSLPQKKDWSLSHLNWHLDLAPPKVDRPPGIQVFILIHDVQPRGGATLALAASHRLHYVNSSQTAHELLRNHSLFYSRPELFLQSQEVCGINVQIVEMSGRAGDVFLMDLRVLHSPSLNSQRQIRMMATNRFFKTDFYTKE